MAYDFQAAVNAAKAVVEKTENSNSSNYTYPLVYPQAGQSITVRLLFNPASGQIVRLVNRHEKVACYRTYGIDCPICKVMQQVKDMTGQDPFGRTKASRSRGIAFAQYVSSTNPIDKGNNKGNLQPGELILFMFPWSVYTQINQTIQAIAQTPTGMDQAFSHAQTGLFLQINVTSDFKYTVTQNPYLTLPVQQSDDDFMKMLDSMESLSEMVLPSTITEDVDKQVREYSEAIYRQYVAPRVPNQAPVQSAPVNYSQGGVPTAPAGGYIPTNPSAPAGPQFSQPQYSAPQVPNAAPQAPQFDPTQNYASPPPPVASYTPAPPTNAAPAQGTGAPRPACFGNHKPGDPQCICCPCEVLCMQPTGEETPF